MKVLVAVSGGVDSICLLDSLARGMLQGGLVNDFLKESEIELLEACYIDHGQRSDTKKDVAVINKLIAQLNGEAGSAKIELHIINVNLGEGCSEASARQERYKALEGIMTERGLDRIATAHHADDVMETAIINLIRGTGPKGLTSLRHNPEGLWRPFLFGFGKGSFVRKTDLLKYANVNGLEWNEDTTNKSDKYLRNRVRLKLEVAEEEKKILFLENLCGAYKTNSELSTLEDRVASEVNIKNNTYRRLFFQDNDSQVAGHILHSILSKYAIDLSRDHVSKALDFVINKNKGNELHLRNCQLRIMDKDSFEVISGKINKS